VQKNKKKRKRASRKKPSQQKEEGSSLYTLDWHFSRGNQGGENAIKRYLFMYQATEFLEKRGGGGDEKEDSCRPVCWK